MTTTLANLWLVGWATLIVAAEFIIATIVVWLTIGVLREFGPRDHDRKPDKDWRWDR